MAKSGFEHKITFRKQQNRSTVANNTQNRKRNVIWFNPTNIGKKFFSLLDKHFPKTHQLHKLFNRNNVKVSYSSLLNFQSMIKGHNKNILNQQGKPSPCNCRDKISCPLKGSCQHNTLVCSCKVSAPDLKQNHLHYIGLTDHTFKDRLYKHSNSFKYESKRNSTEIFNFIWGKRKEKINVDLDWSILDKVKSYSPFSKKCILCLRHENKFYLANYKTYHHNCLFKTLFPKRL